MRSLQTASWMTLMMIGVLSLFSPVDAQETVPEGVVFEKNIEYSNPDDQHLQLNMARPKEGTGPFPAGFVFTVADFAQARERALMDFVCSWRKEAMSR